MPSLPPLLLVPLRETRITSAQASLRSAFATFGLPETPPDLNLFSPEATESADIVANSPELPDASAQEVASPIPDNFQEEMEGTLKIIHSDN